MTARWSPSVTVAAVIDDGGAVPRFLLVEEETPEGLRLNNPAGHLEPGETPLEGVVREALEETARAFVPQALLGLYLSRFVRPARDGHPAQDVTYLRIAYRGHVGEPIAGRTPDREIRRTLWLTADEIRAERARHRSPLVMRCIDDHLAGRALPLDAVRSDASLAAPWVLVAGAGGGSDNPRPMSSTPEPDAPAAAPADTPASTLTAATADSPAMAAAAAAAAGVADPAAHADGKADVSPTGAPGPDPQALAQASPDAEVQPAAESTDKSTADAAVAAVASEADTTAPSAAAPKTEPARPEPTLAQTAAELATLFPALFAPGAFKPIKLRVQVDIQQRAPGRFTRRQLSVFLHRHTTSTAYLRQLAAVPQRFDLDGQPAGEVAAEHRDAAAAEVERRRALVAERRAAQRAMQRAAPAGAAPDGPAPADGGHGGPGPHAKRPDAGPGRPAHPPRPPRHPQQRPGDRAPRPGQAARAPHARPDRARPQPQRPHVRHANAHPGPHAGPEPRPQRPAAAPGPDSAALPDDPARRERALLLRAWESSPLAPANFCALKGLPVAEFDALIQLARRERSERGARTERTERTERTDRPGRDPGPR